MRTKNIEQLKKMKLTKDSIFIDGGSHKGQELEFLSKIGCEVHSFEVNPVWIEELQKKYLQFENITINPAALWIEDSTIDAYYKNTSDLGSMSTVKCKKNNNKSGRKITVKSIDIAQYIMQMDKKIDVLKLDIEGGEYDVIGHLIETGTIDKIKYIYFEDHEGKMDTSPEAKTWRSKKNKVKEMMEPYAKKFKGWW